MKICGRCCEEQPLAQFRRNPRAADGLSYCCRSCEAEAKRRYQKANPEKVREARRRYQSTGANAESVRRYREANPDALREARRKSDRKRAAAARAAVLDHYGRVCACCGATVRLTIDHVNGDGKEHRTELGGGGSMLYRWLVRNGFPGGFQVLCWRCNVSKRNGPCCRLDHASEVAR